MRQMEDRPKFNKRILSFIPYKYVIVSTSLSLDDVVKLFASSTSPVFDPISNPLPNPQKLQGDVSKEGFRVRLTDYYRISWTSVKGYFHPTKRGILLINICVDPGPNFLFLLLLPFMGAIAYELLKTTIFK